MSDRVVQPSEPAFTVVLRGKHFELSDTQIRFDSPNKFTGVFLGGNGGTDIMYSDRRPEYFPIISEWLAGYEDMFPIHLEGMSEQVATRAILAEAEHFKLKKLAARLKTALDRAEPLDQPLMWPFTGSQEGTFFRVRPVVHEFADIVKKYPDGVPREVFEARPTASAQFYWFHDLQVRFDCRQLSAQGLPTVSVLFLNREIQAADSTAQQASVTIDRQPLSLAVLLKWIASPKVVSTKDSPLEPLATYFRPEGTPQADRIVTIRVHRAAGYIRGDLRIAHLDIFSNHQGYMLWRNVGYDHTSNLLTGTSSPKNTQSTAPTSSVPKAASRASTSSP
ncbi:hypothetical protein NBRC10512_002729 [Rhodotorula toruloides]|uniref:RHTO0S11e05886g1_1 n=2 Tax=Rhodotorula toruloides TaxID=5286 RepID=A0A061BDC2_RHOTO|nr:uncharacterized protein RHTO_01609 [Rhodotorula toruloides NP11]EMS21549.1 hypothetical protein RHTO_01609 [Rhodotorula toruloides NP11]CDR45876.1 RHTO0S11e05886g1_1 [Rhodotorula toruloides]